MKLCFIGSGIERESTQVSSIEITSIARVMRTRFDTLVFGGSRIGLMGAFADAFRRSDGNVISVLPQWLEAHGLAYPAGETIRCNDLAERKRFMFDAVNAVLCYPGGTGTWDELFDLLTRHAVDTAIEPASTCPPIYLYNWEKFYAPLLLQIETAMEIGLIPPHAVAMIRPFETAEQLLALLDTESPPRDA